MTVDYINFQMASGAHAVQLFESFAEVIPLEIYKKFVQPTHEKIFSSLSPNAHSILFTKESPHLDLMLQSGASVLSVGNCIDLAQAKKRAPKMIFQGNVDIKFWQMVLRKKSPKQSGNVLSKADGRTTSLT